MKGLLPWLREIVCGTKPELPRKCGQSDCQSLAMPSDHCGSGHCGHHHNTYCTFFMMVQCHPKEVEDKELAELRKILARG